jgi:D-threonate/D-erythronate kinase
MQASEMPSTCGCLTGDVAPCTTAPMPTLRLLADDLTGALDSAAELVPLVGRVPVFWDGTTPTVIPATAAIDSGTRESTPDAAMLVVADLAKMLDGADIAFKKIDSLMRGSTLVEIAAVAGSGYWRSCVLAPAFPFQGRITRDGQQYADDKGVVKPVSRFLPGALQDLGVCASVGTINQPLRPGINVFDAMTNADLQAVVSGGMRHSEPILWIGTGGLAHALAQRQHETMPLLARPILGLFGSDHPVTAAQLAACGSNWQEVAHDLTALDLRRLSQREPLFLSFRLPSGTPRSDAATLISAAIGRICSVTKPPGTVVVAGGETVRSLCTSVDAEFLEVTGRLMPGIPRSIIRGGPWDGVTVVSKSGAFGAPDLLRQLPLFGDDQS